MLSAKTKHAINQSAVRTFSRTSKIAIKWQAQQDSRERDSFDLMTDDGQFQVNEQVALTRLVHLVPGQLKQPHVLMGNRIEGATGQQKQRNTTSHFKASQHRFQELTYDNYRNGDRLEPWLDSLVPIWHKLLSNWQAAIHLK